MNVRKLLSTKMLAGTALTTTLLMAGGLPAAADGIPLGGYSGSVQLNFSNYESFLTSSGSVTNSPAQGDENFGIFGVTSITTGGLKPQTLWTSGENGDVLVGVFNGITVQSIVGSPPSETTLNTGGTFDLYLVPSSLFPGDQGLAGYTQGITGCSVGQLCYNGITNVGAQEVLTMTLVPGVDGPGITLVGTITAANPATGSAIFDGTVTGTQFLPDVTGKDSFCPNTGGCPGADNSTFALASQDPIIATAVPEPSSLLLFGGGLLGLGWLGPWRRKRRRSRLAM